MTTNIKSVGKFWLWLFFFTACWLVSIGPSGPKSATQPVPLVQGKSTITNENHEKLHLLERTILFPLVSALSSKEDDRVGFHPSSLVC